MKLFLRSSGSAFGHKISSFDPGSLLNWTGCGITHNTCLRFNPPTHFFFLQGFRVSQTEGNGIRVNNEGITPVSTGLVSVRFLYSDVVWGVLCTCSRWGRPSTLVQRDEVVVTSRPPSLHLLSSCPGLLVLFSYRSLRVGVGSGSGQYIRWDPPIRATKGRCLKRPTQKWSFYPLYRVSLRSGRDRVQFKKYGDLEGVCHRGEGTGTGWRGVSVP